MIERLHNLWKRILGLHVCYYATDVTEKRGIQGIHYRCKTCGKRMSGS